jgi:Protein of unknown function (DUF3435)
VDLRRTTSLWVASDLCAINNLNREPKVKPTAYCRDVEIVIAAIWRFQSIAALKSIRSMLNVTLLINLLIDGASRIGEFLPLTPEAESEQKYLTWGDLNFYITPTDDGVTIYIVILSKWLKNHTHDIDGHKSFIVRLLSPHVVLQDTCRLLVLLALHEGRFKHFKTWNQLMNCKPSPDGSSIQVKDSALKLPVITSGEFGIDAVDTNEKPWSYVHLVELINYLSRLTFFRDKIILTSLRRGDAYILDQYCARLNTARRLMGQGADSEAFETYLSKTSVTDIQALARNVATEDLTCQD